MKFSQILLFSIGPIFAAVIGLILVPLLTWIVPQDDIGRFALYNIIVSFCLIASSLGLDQSFVRDFHESNNKKSLLALCFFPGFLMLLLILGGLLYLEKYVGSAVLTFNSTFRFEIIIFGIAIAFIYRYTTLLLRMENKGLAYSISQFFPRLILLLSLLIALFLQHEVDIYFLIISNVLSLSISTFIFILLTGHYWRKLEMAEWSVKYLGALLSYGAPLVFSGLAYWGLTAQDKLFLTKLSSLEELGLYSVAMSFAGIAMILKTLFQTLWAPAVFSWIHDDENLKKIDEISLIMVFLVTICFCVVGLGSDLIPFLVPNSYASVSSLVIACVGFPLFFALSEASGIGINIVKKSSLNLYLSIFTLLINGLLNYSLIPSFGAKGAAAATIISFWIYFMLRTLASWFYWRKFPLFKICFFPGLCLVFSICHLFSSYSEKSYVMILWLALFFGAWFSFANLRAKLLEFILEKSNR